MKLIIAEKPDQGMKLAAPFTYVKKNNYLQIAPNDLFPNGAYLTWAVGHLCELVPPEEYNPGWKKWSLETLPLVPERFKHRVTRGKGKQFQLIKQLLHRNDVTSVIIGSDAGREGEAIVRIILALCKNNKPIERLWISSLTPNAVRHGFQNLLTEQATRAIYDEALSRACADWLVGMNASRAYTLLLKQKGISDVFSTGRVQTPTLAMIVKREKEIESFKPEPFWEVSATFGMNGKQYEGKWHKDGETRLQDEQMAKAIANFCHAKKAEATKVEKERKEFQPPYLYNLSGLQAAANKIYQFSPKKTLDLAQKLYVKGIISYPRADSSFVTKEEAQQFPQILNKLSQLADYKNCFPVPNQLLINNKRFVNEKKVTDHYAIIPTEQVTDPQKLSGDEQKIYDLIVRSLIAAHYNNAVFDYTTIHTVVDGRASFLSKGKEQIEEGWRKVVYHKQTKRKENDEPLLPSITEGETGEVIDAMVKDGMTQAPKRYTEGQLITLMKTAGRHLDDKELSKVLKQTEGLGTEATRAGIIGVLKDRSYIEVQKNQVFATEKGKLLIAAVGDQILASAEMTAKWEERLHEIGRGHASSQVFMEQAKKLSHKLVEDAKKHSHEWSFDGLDVSTIQRTNKKKSPKPAVVGKCKQCQGNVIDKGSFYGCINYAKTKCDFTLSKKMLGKTISQVNAKKLLKEGKTNLIKGFKKGDKTFDAYVTWSDSEKRIRFTFPSK